MSARGKLKKRWPQLEACLRAEGFPFQASFTERHGHATELARASVQDGFDLIVAVGGDGTVNEVVNGLMADGRAINPDAALGIIPSGTGSDFCRSVGIARDMLAAARQLANAQGTRKIDIGEMTCGADGRTGSRYFANVAGIGFDAETVERLERKGKRGGGTLPYLSALVTTIFRYQNKDVVMHLDSRAVSERVNDVMVCNGRYLAGGMFVAPHASQDDGLFDVIVLGDLNAFEVLVNTPKVYNGTHLTVPKVSEYRAKSVTVVPKQPMWIEADGEFVGEGPVTFTMHPAALNLRV